MQLEGGGVKYDLYRYFSPFRFNHMILNTWPYQSPIYDTDVQVWRLHTKRHKRWDNCTRVPSCTSQFIQSHCDSPVGRSAYPPPPPGGGGGGLV